MNAIPVRYIDNNGLLQSACADLSQSSTVAVDTEFFRETTYYPIPALVQLFAKEVVYVVDCLTIDNWQPLITLFEDLSVTKVLHSCSEDMEVFYRLLATLPRPVIDTQIAAAIAGLGFSLGYQNIVKQILNEQVDKEQTRSNWLRRPLSSAQIQYAANDVIWLPRVWEHLQSTLNDQGRLNWCEQDCSRLLDVPVPSLLPADFAYLRLKSAWRLSGVELHILRALCTWRENLAQTLDVPRSRVITDACALEISRRRPSSLTHLKHIEQLRDASRAEYGDEIIAIIERAASDDASEWPDALSDRSEPEFKRKLKLLKGLVEQQAKALSLPPEILGRKRELEKILESPTSSEVLQGWRAELLGSKIAEIVSVA